MKGSENDMNEKFDNSERRGRERRMLERARVTVVSVALLVVISLVIASASAFVHISASADGGDTSEGEMSGSVQSSEEQSGDMGGEASASESESSVDETPRPLYQYASVTSSTATITSEINSDYAILIDADNNTVIAEKNMDKRIYPASMTKIMTLVIAYEAVTDWNTTFTMTADILIPLSQMNASVAGYMPGDVIPIKDLFYGSIVPSGADCTAALAILTAGSEDAFAVLMNQKAAELGMTNTHFVNASGLHDDDHYSTLGDIAILMQYALSIDFCRDVLDTEKYVTTPVASAPNGITLWSTSFSRIQHNITANIRVNGSKTGFTDEAMYCMVSGIKVNGNANYICICAHGDVKMSPAEDITYICKNYLS